MALNLIDNRPMLENSFAKFLEVPFYMEEAIVYKKPHPPDRFGIGIIINSQNGQCDFSVSFGSKEDRDETYNIMDENSILQIYETILNQVQKQQRQKRGNFNGR